MKILEIILAVVAAAVILIAGIGLYVLVGFALGLKDEEKEDRR